MARAMVRITRVYTGGGDAGESSLVNGKRLSKADLRFEVVGTTDELNCVIGIILNQVATMPEHDDGGRRQNVERINSILVACLGRIQHELFDLGAELACPLDDIPQGMQVLQQAHSDVLLDEMDAWLDDLTPLNSFILPGGDGPIAYFHLARALTRRLERHVVQLSTSEGMEMVRPLTMQYINRLSDWLFVLSRWVTHMLGGEETLWQPLGRRESEQGVAKRVVEIRQLDQDLDHLS